MNDEIRLSRLKVSRRRALSIGGTIGLGGLLAACGQDGGDGGTTEAAGPSGTTTAKSELPAGSDLVARLDKAPSCVLATEETQGPFWFDVDSIRSDIREGRPGARLDLALRVQDMSKCKSGGEAAPIADAVVEIWHCDAGGLYSGFESGSTGPGGGGPGGQSGSGATSDGSYSKGDVEATTTDDGTYLRGAQVANADGIVRFATLYPGWYMGRTVHIHLKAHIDKRTVVTTQLYFDDKLNDAVFKTSPYDERGERDTFNDGDSIYDDAGLVTVSKGGDGYLGVLNLGVNA